MEKVFEKEESFYEIKNQVQEKILKADNGIDNKILKRIYDEALSKGNQELARELHTAMYDNRASVRVKSAERVSSGLNEWFDKSAFEEKIKLEGDIKEVPLVMEKSEAFKDAPHFTVGMRGADIRNPEVQEDYLNRVEKLTKDMKFQLDFAINRENHMSKTLSAAKEFFGEDLYEKFKAEPVKNNEISISNVLENENKFREVKNEVTNKILNSESGYDNTIFKKIYDETLDKGNLDLARDLHEVMYDNRASQRIKHAERISSSFGENFNREAFEVKIKKEGDVIEKPNIVEKSTVFKDAPYFSVGMRAWSVGSDVQETEKYNNKVSQLTKEMEYQLTFANQKENKIIKTLEAVKKFFGEDLYKKYSETKTFSNKLGAALMQKKEDTPELSKKKELKM